MFFFEDKPPRHVMSVVHLVVVVVVVVSVVGRL